MAKVRLRSGVAAASMALIMLSSLTGCLGLRCGTGCVPNGHDQVIAAPNGASHPGVAQPSSCGTPGCTSCGQRTGHFGKHRGGQEQGAVIMEQPGGPQGPCPDEIHRVSLPPYKVAPPDILFIDLIRMVPKPPYRVQPLETLVIFVDNVLPGEPIGQIDKDGRKIPMPFVISPEGTINLGYRYGNVYVAGMTLDQIHHAIRNHLTPRIVNNAQVSVSLANFRGYQQVRGEQLVRPDGTISLGVYGSVYVAGLSLGQAKCVIEKHLSEYFLNPEVSVDVFAYNSRVVYVIFDGGHLGQQIFPLPSTGNETVLDAISKVQGLAPVSSKKRIWVARPAPANLGCNQILPVDWRAITEAGSTATNYQLFPGDRLYVSANPIIAFDNWLSIVLAPVERVLGVTFLATQTFSNNSNNNNN